VTAARGNLRRHPRSAVELSVTVADSTNSVVGHIHFDTQDLSVGGAFVRSDLLFEVGEELGLTFTLPDGKHVHARGRVVRVARDTGDEGIAGMGIEFVRLTDPDRDAILALVTRGSHG
jgi:Tfp pilus assembly protein PilZ